MRAVQISEFGGPEVLEVVDLPDPEPGEGEVLVEVARAGMNFADTHQRQNDYLAKAELPLIPGGEISGRTPDGRRVAAMLPNGGYAERVAVPAGRAGADPRRGLRRPGRRRPAPGPDRLDAAAGQRPASSRARRVVVQAAAGGTGTLAVQLAKRMGAAA